MPAIAQYRCQLNRVTNLFRPLLPCLVPGDRPTSATPICIEEKWEESIKQETDGHGPPKSMLQKRSGT
jgi:hypothetical protein